MLGADIAHAGCLVLCAIAVRAFAWSQTAVMFNDGPVYLALADAMAGGDWDVALTHPYHPLYPALIAGFRCLGLPLETAAVSVAILGGLLMIAGLFGFLDVAFGRTVAWLGAWILALHPWAIDFSSDVMSDSLYGGFFLIALACLARWLAAAANAVLGWALLCGSAIGLAYLARPEGLGLLGVVAIGIFRVAWQKPGANEEPTHSGERPVRALIALGLSVGLFASPYIATISRDAGTLIVSAKKSVGGLAKGESDPARIVDRETWARPAPGSARIWLPQSSVVARPPTSGKPTRDLGGLFESIALVARTSLASLRYEVALFALLGILCGRIRETPGDRSPPWRGWVIGSTLLFYSGLLVLLVWGAGYVSRRHALVACLPLIGYAAIGWQVALRPLIDRLSIRGATRLASRTAWATGCLLLVLALVWGPRDLRPRREDRRAVREAAHWIAAHHPDSGPVAAQKLRTAYYANARFVPIPSGHDDALKQHLVQGGARWLIIDESRLADHRGLEEGLGQWLHVVHRVSAHGRTAWVLDVTK